MADAEEDFGADGFWTAFFRPFRLRAVRSLLAGNDTGCFSTEQYRQAYMRVNPIPAREAQHLRIPREELFTPAGARGHLLSLPDVVREVKPDVWALVEMAE